MKLYKLSSVYASMYASCGYRRNPDLGPNSGENSYYVEYC